MRVDPDGIFPLLGIDEIWSSGRMASDASPACITVVPDGCIDLIWRVSLDARGQMREGALLVAGPDTLARQVSVPGGMHHVGVRMLPGWARRFFEVDPADLLDQVVSADALRSSFRDLNDRLEAAPDLSSARQTLTAAVVTGLHPPPTQVLRTIEGLRRGFGVGQIAAELGVVPRTLQRSIHDWTGHAPKKLARILRFHAAWRQLSLSEPMLAELAMEAGYADQAHMAREFAALGAAAPSRWRVKDDVRFVQDRDRKIA